MNSFILILLYDFFLLYTFQYIQFLRESRIDELMPGLLNIINSSLRYDFEIDDLLESFKHKIERAVEYYKHNRALYITKFLYKMSIYYLVRNKNHVAIDIILQGLELSDILNDTRAFIKFTVIFESTRKKCTEDQQTRYYQIIDQLLKEN